MRSRLMIGTALLAVPLLAGCGGTATAGGGTAPSSSAPVTTRTATTSPGPSDTGSPSAGGSPTAPAGPVLTGTVYTLTLPRGAEIDTSSPAWSRAWSLGLGLHGQAMELPCDGCGDNTPQTRAKQARDLIHHGKGTVLPDVTVNGVTLFHVTTGPDGFRSDYYGAFYGGEKFQLVFDSTHPYKQTAPVIAATLATLQLRG